MKTRYFVLAGIAVVAAVFAYWRWGSVDPNVALAANRIVDVEFDPSSDADFRINGADVRCGADRVVSVQSRTYTNQGNIEFWCRENNQPLPRFENIGKSIPQQFGSSIMNISGRMYDIISQSFFGRWHFWQMLGHWRQWEGTGKPVVDGGRVINLQIRGGKTYRFVISGKTCSGISLFSDDGYHGTYQGKDWRDWSAMYTDGKIVAANIGHRMRFGRVPEAGPLDHCRPLDLKPVGPRDWVYAITPIPGGLLYGGSLSPPYVGCAQLRFLDFESLKVSSIPLPGCTDKLVTEFYSFSKHGNEILIGNYPYARLYAIDPKTRKVWLTNLVKMRPSDHVFRGIPYRESQSVLSADGAVWVGLYPWSELLVIDGKTTKSIRILKAPSKNGADFAPYASLMTKNFLRRNDAPTVSAVPISQQIWARNHALYVDSWSQRIPSVVSFSGRICLSTANFTGFPYDPHLHPLPPEEAKKYGDIFCAKLPNQVQVPKTKDKLRLVLTDKYMGIEKDGVVLAETEHHLSQKALHEIAAAMAAD